MHGPFSKILGARAPRPQDRRPARKSTQTANIISAFTTVTTITSLGLNLRTGGVRGEGIHRMRCGVLLIHGYTVCTNKIRLKY